jgi:hypothetical protein
MAERQHTVVCVFDKRSPRIYIREGIYAQLHLPDDDVQMVQVDGPNRHVYIKFVSNEKMSAHLPHIIGSREYLYTSGEVSKVEVTPTGLGYREVRIARVLAHIWRSI